MDSQAQDELDIQAIKSRSVKGMATLTGGGLILTLISGIGVLLLTTFLGPQEFGIYGLVVSVIVVLSYFSDIGLAASLIQKKEKLSTSDLRTTFTIQQSLVMIILVITLTLTKYIFAYYHFSQQQSWLFYSLLLSFFLSSLKSIPSVMLERALRFDRIMLVRIIETLVFNITAVFLAVKNYGVLSYMPAVLLQSFVGLILIYILNPWPIGLAFSLVSLKKLLKFGVPYQLNSLLAVAKDQMVNLFLYKIVGTSGMGLVNWGFYYSQMPQRLVMDNATKVAFPALSRMQNNDQELKKSVETLLRFITLTIFPALILIGLCWSHLAYLVPKWFKWQPGLISLYLFCFSAAMSCLSTPLTNTLYAMGKAKIVTYLMIMWLGLEWLFKPTFAIKFGFQGISYAAALISLSSLVPFFLAHKYIGFNILKSLKTPVLASFLMLLAGILVRPFGLVISLLTAGFVYLLGLGVLGGQDLLNNLKPFYTYFRAKI